MVRLTKLKIDRFRNVKPGTVLEFGPTFNVLLGKNATGKTTLLDLIAAVTNDDLRAYAEEDVGFDVTWWLDGAAHQLELRAARTQAKDRGPLDSTDRARGEKAFDDVWSLVIRTGSTEAARIEVTGMRGALMVRGGPRRSFDVAAGLAAGLANYRALRAARAVHDLTDADLFTAEQMVGRGCNPL